MQSVIINYPGLQSINILIKGGKLYIKRLSLGHDCFVFIYVLKQLVEKTLIKAYQIKNNNVALTRGGLHVARAGQHIHYVGKQPRLYIERT